MLALALLSSLTACTGGQLFLDTGPVGRDCGAGLWEESFASREEMECGLGESGPVYCHWALSFGDGTYTWSYSDITETGTVTCADGELTGVSAGGDPRRGTFHRATARVTWEGESYEQAE